MSAFDAYLEGVFLREGTCQGVSVAKTGVSVANLGVSVDSTILYGKPEPDESDFGILGAASALTTATQSGRRD